MQRITRLVHLGLVTALLVGFMPASVMARAASNVGHGVTCYTNPVTGERICMKRP